MGKWIDGLTEGGWQVDINNIYNLPTSHEVAPGL